jgi:hypothetical protein
VELKLNETYQHLPYTDYVNLLRDKTDTIKKNTVTSTHDSNKVSVEKNVEKIEYMLVSHHQNAGQNWNIK